ncbi:discoidin domain-containing protein [Pseudobacteroides cellulosolvens]|uniref:Coagulation factor 5/8 type domain protein n=1 Tax=Pseudobacteroides cellulosolvens ATCC 35603 = DSM 2933 TaxID=398512 RepID=A0A0L6JJA2_9FIRM|nr:discoidin domain-containing protein [Pseudobacteroides cellulosolvens]KNY25956.1 coagulation factor 5/8 type domain protein [Pseudobacteroides cellulosolvens ATCC 35603 = DSM 2933]
MKKVSLILIITLLMTAVFYSFPSSFAADEQYPGFKVKGRFLYDKNGEKTILYGVNKMIIWMDVDGVPSYEEIAKTGANSVRIVWGISGTPEKLDKAIYNCRLNHMIPIIECHDATGEWSKLQTVVDYWVRPDILEVLKKHQEYLIVNIANECGQTVSDADYRAGYKLAVSRMRTAGIHVPLMIDAPSYGQGIDSLQANGPYLIENDPDQNLLFSVHMWWPLSWGYSDQKVKDEIKQSVDMNLPLVVGEFGHQWDETAQGAIPYKTILEQCHLNEVGYLPWEWGPGNNPQTFLDMTTDSTFATLQGWGKEVCITNPHSIKNIAVRPKFMQEDVPPPPTPTPYPAGNMALNKTIESSTNQDSEFTAKNAVDGNGDTRWASVSGKYDTEYIKVDLGSVSDINRVVIYWEDAYATQYKILTSADGSSWTTAYQQYNGKGGLDEIKLDKTYSARYVKVECSQKVNSEWGYSIWEVLVYGQSVGTPTPTPTPTPNGKTISGYVRPDFDSTTTSSPVKAGFKVEFGSLSAVTDQNGAFTLNDVPLTIVAEPLKVSKDGYLTRVINGINAGDKIGSINSPLEIWAGDIAVNGVQDGSINMSDVIALAKGFNAVSTDSKYIASCDLNKDNSINMSDVIILAKHFNMTTSNYPAFTGVTR